MIRRLRWPTVLLAAAMVVVACDSAGERATEPTRSPAPSGSAFPDTKSAAAKETAEVTLAFGGDVHFAERTLKLLDDPATAIGPASALLSAADVAMVNLETAVTEGGVPEPKQFHFRAPDTALTALAEAGVDVTTMANNHSLDYGQAGLLDTFAAIERTGHPVVGIGRTDNEAFAPWIKDVRGTKVAFLGLSQIRERAPQWSARPDRPGVASTLDPAVGAAAVKAARAVADVVVVYLHWGQEGEQCPTPRMKTLATALAAAGADAIVSTHAHLLLGDGYLGRTYVQYGLGNFVWWWDNAFSNDTGVLNLTVRGRDVVKAELKPARISSTGQPVPVTGAEAARITAKYQKLRACTGLAATPAQ